MDKAPGSHSVHPLFPRREILTRNLACPDCSEIGLKATHGGFMVNPDFDDANLTTSPVTHLTINTELITIFTEPSSRNFSRIVVMFE